MRDVKGAERISSTAGQRLKVALTVLDLSNHLRRVLHRRGEDFAWNSRQTREYAKAKFNKTLGNFHGKRKNRADRGRRLRDGRDDHDHGVPNRPRTEDYIARDSDAESVHHRALWECINDAFSRFYGAPLILSIFHWSE